MYVVRGEKSCGRSAAPHHHFFLHVSDLTSLVPYVYLCLSELCMPLPC